MNEKLNWAMEYVTTTGAAATVVAAAATDMGAIARVVMIVEWNVVGLNEHVQPLFPLISLCLWQSQWVAQGWVVVVVVLVRVLVGSWVRLGCYVFLNRLLRVLVPISFRIFVREYHTGEHEHVAGGRRFCPILAWCR